MKKKATKAVAKAAMIAQTKKAYAKTGKVFQEFNEQCYAKYNAQMINTVRTWLGLGWCQRLWCLRGFAWDLMQLITLLKILDRHRTKPADDRPKALATSGPGAEEP